MRNDRDNSDRTEAGIEEIRNDIHMFRYETHNNILDSKSSVFKSLSSVHKGISIIGKPVFAKHNGNDILEKYEEFSNFEKNFDELEN